MSHAEKDITKAKRVVIKVGSALLVDAERGVVHRSWLETLADDIGRMRDRGQEVLIVTSGAVAIGRRHLAIADGALRLEEKQAAAAAGMVRLAHAYQEVLGQHDLTVAQVLLTLDDTESRRRYLNARNTIDAILRLGGVPLINENDTVATDEIRVGDNDRLAARVAAMVSADLLILLSDVDGLYSADPAENQEATLIEEVRAITPEIEAMAGHARSDAGSGGMATKIKAAKIALPAGVSMLITDGRLDHPVQKAETAKGVGMTWFIPESTPRQARKQWIAGSLKPQGSLVVDDGAVKALRANKSLLPAGVSSVEGAFQRGDAVSVKTTSGEEIARGLSAYAADDVGRIAGAKSADIESILGYRRRDEIIHRDDLVLL